jgi:hypothetical protein
MKTNVIVLVLAVGLLAVPAPTAEFTDWTNVNHTADIAEGVLDGISVTFTGHDVTDSSVTDGSFTYCSASR